MAKNLITYGMSFKISMGNGSRQTAIIVPEVQMTLGFSFETDWKIWLHKHKQNKLFNLVHMALNLRWYLPFSRVFSDPLTVRLRIYEFDWLECGSLKRSLRYKNNIGEKKIALQCKLVHHTQMTGRKRAITSRDYAVNCKNVQYLLTTIWNESSSCVPLTVSVKLVKIWITVPSGDGYNLTSHCLSSSVH